MYIVQEIQTSNGQTVLLPAVTEEDENKAESAWHSVMSAAAISSVEVHTVIMYDEHGNVKLQGFYEHILEAANEPE